MIEQNRQTVLAFIAAMSDGDSTKAAECLGPDAVAVTKGHSNFTGSCDRDTIVKLVGSMKQLVPTGLRVTIRNVIAEGDAVVVEFEGDALTCEGKPYRNQYCMVFTLADGKIVRSHEYFCTKHAEEVLWPVVAKAGLEGEAGSR